MAQKETHSEHGDKLAFVSRTMADLAAMGQKRMEVFTHTQSELFDKLQEANQRWLDRIQVEAKSASEFASKLTGARSIPDAITAYQEWASQCFEMMTEDRKHLLDDYQNFAKMSARLLAPGWQWNGVGTST